MLTYKSLDVKLLTLKEKYSLHSLFLKSCLFNKCMFCKFCFCRVCIMFFDAFYL